MYTVEEFDKGKTKVLKYILYKKRSEKEIKKKFSREIEENLLEDIIEYLKEAKYIDDKEYIKKTINNFMALKNMSIREIEYKLYSKGINREDIEEYIYQNEEELKQYETKSAINIVNKKIATLEIEEIKKYLIKKGYNSDTVNIALTQIS